MNIRILVFSVFFILFVIELSAQKDPVVLRVDSRDVKLSEFEYYYQSKKGIENFSLFSFRDILEQFITLQLKVVAAEEAGLNRDADIVNRFNQFRNRLTDDTFIRREDLGSVRREDKPVYRVESVFYPVTQQSGNIEDNRVALLMDSLYRICITGEGGFVELLPASDLYQITIKPVRENEMVEEIEQVLSGLLEGEISRPFRAAPGWYIIRLLHQGREQPFPAGLPQYNDPSVIQLVEEIKKKYNYRENREVLEALRRREVVSGIVFTLNDYAVHADEFLAFAKYYPGGFKKQYDAFITKMLIAHRYDQVMVEEVSWKGEAGLYYSELLADRLVSGWIKEQQESLEKNFEAYKSGNRKKYDAPESAFRGIVVESVSKSLFRHIKKITKKNPEERWEELIQDQFNKDDIPLVKVISGEFAEGENKYTDHLIFKTSGAPAMSEKYPYVRLFGKKTMRERSAENVTEEKMMEDYLKQLCLQQEDVLRSRYKVELFEDVLKTVNYN